MAARELGAIPLSRLTTAAIEDGYLALLTGEKPLTRATVRFVHRILVLALNRAMRRELIAVNPAINAAPAGNRGERRPQGACFQSEEVTVLLAAAERDDQPDTLAIVLLLLVAGLRRAELLGITVNDVDLDNGSCTYAAR